ncbi:phage tail tape measure protein [Flavobacterium beibuense]|uniref:phage tail tape measure protein n=1 Tax=Flavobacterium beibuense TaxID=657326 RepID=UPI003A9125E1
MSDKKTSWILEMVDELTKPAKEIMKSAKAMAADIMDVSDAVKLNEKDTRTALDNSKKYYKELEGSIKEVEGELKQLEKVKKSGSWKEQMEAAQAYDKAQAKLDRYRKALQGAEDDIKDLNEEVKNFERNAQKWTDLATGINQGIELIQKAADGLEFTVDVANLTTDIQRMTDITGSALDDIVSKTRHLSKVYDEDAVNIARAANTMTEQIGGSFEENLALIEEGFKKGANINGDFIDQLREYPTFIKQLGISQSEAIALMAQAGKKGIFSDKAIDSLKEGNLALREMGKTQIDALAGINMSPDDLVGKTPFEAMKLITSKMKDMAPQARQMILTDLFKGAGEDAGLAFIEGLSDMDLDLTNLPSVQQAGAGIKGFFADISTWAAQMFGDVGIYAQQFAPIFQTIAAGIPILQALSKVTMIQNAVAKVATAVQWAWNAAMTANPIGVIIVAIGALVAAIAWVATKTEGWGEAWQHTWNGAKLYFEAFVKGVKWYYSSLVDGIMIGLNAIQEGWYKFKLAVGMGDEDENRAALDRIHQDTERRKKEIVDGAKEVIELTKKGNEEFSKAFNSVKLKKDNKEQEAQPSIQAYAQGTPDVLGKPKPAATGGKKEGGGLNVGSGSGGIKSITMNLNIKNTFNVTKGTDTRSLADAIVGQVNDRMRDAVVNLGG